MMARSTIAFVAVLASGVLLGACAGDATAPLSRADVLAPGGSSQVAAVNTSNGVYTFTIDPSKANGLWMGQHKLNIPADGICNLTASGYGPAFWDAPCPPQGGLMTITAVVSTTADGHPLIDFSPALRFNPATNVSLYMWDAKASAGAAKKLSISYCALAVGDGMGCVNEASVDPTLQTQFVPGTYYLYRRIKHFSGYVVLGATDEPAVVE